MSTPQRIQRKRTKGSRAPLDENGLRAIYVGRPSAFGNPFEAINPECAAQCVKSFEEWIKGERLGCLPERRAALLRRLPELRGRNLSCWCAEGRACHADVLIEMANTQTIVFARMIMETLESLGGEAEWVKVLNLLPPETNSFEAFSELKPMEEAGLIYLVTKIQKIPGQAEAVRSLVLQKRNFTS